MVRKIRSLAFIISALFWGSGAYAENKVYIEQVGSSNVITITQIGDTNRVGDGGLNQTSKITGSNNILTTMQTGDANIIDYTVVRSEEHTSELQSH